MISAETRQKLKSACILFGGQKQVAAAAGVNRPNFGRWLNNNPTLSQDNVNLILKVMGLPNLRPDTSKVHTWKINKVEGVDFTEALKLYFPKGGDVCRSGWPLIDTSCKTLSDSFQNLMFLYAMTDGHVRVVLRHTLNSKDNRVPYLKSHLEWKNGDELHSQLTILENYQKWVSGCIAPDEFDLAWNNQGLSMEAQNVISTIEKEGISYREAIRRIRKYDNE